VAFKAKVALETLAGDQTGDQTLAELSARHKVHPNLIAKWKRQAVAGLINVFSGTAGRREGCQESEIKKLHAKFG